jgi:chromosome transmission fidelity protein 1
MMPDPGWVIAQTMERHRRELEAEEAEYEERLASARKKEASLKKMAKARVTKKPVRASHAFISPLTHVGSLHRN